MASDIAPELYSAISSDFNNRFWADPVIRALYRRVEEGKADYTEANQFAQRAGEICSDVLRRHLTEETLPNGTLYYNIAQRTVTPALTRMHVIIDEVCQDVQTSMNEKAGVGLAAQPVPVDESRIDGIVSAAADAETLEQAQREIASSTVNYARHVTDEAVRRNADFQSKAGLSPKIVRTTGSKACDWCASLAGTYDYESVKNTGNDVFRRHRACRCNVTFVMGKTRQNVWSKRSWEADEETLEERKTLGLSDGREHDKIEERKQVGPTVGRNAGQREIEFALRNHKDDKTSDVICNTLIEYHAALANYTPESMKETLEEIGYQTLPLGKGNFKGIDFQDGGGYRVNFGGDGIFQYHPDARSHHDGAYWKVGNGKQGMRRYGLDGTPKKD